MIKINLALRKQSSVASSGTRTGMGNLTALSSSFKTGVKGVDSDSVKEILRKVGVPLFVALGASYTMDDFQAKEISKKTELVAKERARQTGLQNELKKTKEYEEKKKALEADEAMLRNKIDTIQKLMDDRTTPPKILIALSNAIPADVWLAELAIQEDRIVVLGYALEFNNISDFMKALTDSAYFTDISPPETRNVKDEAGRDVYSFSLVARRR